MASSKPTSTTPASKYILTDNNGATIATSNDGTFNISSSGTYNAGNGGETINITGASNITVNTNNAGDTVDAHGGSGHYTLNGGNGKDFLTGGTSSDVLNGGNGADSIEGGGGNDNITGGNGGDFLSGGSGATGSGNDIFHYGSYLESTYQLGKVTAFNVNTLGTVPFDVIRDFASGDQLDLAALNNQLTGPALPNMLVWYGAQGSDADAGTAHGALAHGVWTDTTGSFLYADVNGDGKADLKIQVSNVDGNSFTPGSIDHLPVIDTANSTLSGTVTEIADTTGDSTTDHAAPNPGTISFTDEDLTDTHTDYSFVADPSNTTSYGTFAFGTFHDSTGGATGTLDWTYGVTDSDIDFLGQGEHLTQKYDVTIKDNHGAAATTVVTVTIDGANDIAKFAGDTTGGVTEDDSGPWPVEGTSESTTGTLTFTDADIHDTHSVDSLTGVVADLGTYGTLSVTNVTEGTYDGVTHAQTADGTIDWQYSVNDADIDYLSAGETKEETFTIHLTETHPDSSTSDATQTVKVTVTGTNDTVVLDAVDVSGAVTEDVGVVGGNISDTGSVDFQDVDHLDTETAAVAFVSATGAGGGTVSAGLLAALQSALGLDHTSFASNAGTVNWTFSVDNSLVQYLNTGESVVVHYDLTMQDNSGASNDTSSAQDITITINGADEPVLDNAPVANNDHWILSNNANVTVDPTWFTWNDSDPDSDPIYVTNIVDQNTGLLPVGWNATYDGSGHLTGLQITGTTTSLNLTYTLSDGTLSSNGSVAVTVVTTDPSNNANDTVNLSALTYDHSYIDGKGGADSVTGGDAINIFVGGTGSDTLIGGPQNDVITGGGGADALTGGLGADTFVYTAKSDSSPGAGNFDTVTGFTSGTDKIDLTALGTLAAQGNLGGGTTINSDSVAWKSDGAGNMVVYVDTSGHTETAGVTSGGSAPDLEIHLTSVASLSASDFLLHV